MIEPTDRSSERIAMISVMPRPVTAEIEAFTMMPSMLRGVRKRGLRSEKQQDHGDQRHDCRGRVRREELLGELQHHHVPIAR